MGFMLQVRLASFFAGAAAAAGYFLYKDYKISHDSTALQTTSPKGGAYLYNVHFWIGKDSSQDEGGTAAIKTVELDSVLGGRAI
ncbi:hypothetical protein ZWY2020_049303 [Hordeum vulgare]|nr:hypothetical protein ZWY2020_049303 [Hordeum vulgare]